MNSKDWASLHYRSTDLIYIFLDLLSFDLNLFQFSLGLGFLTFKHKWACLKVSVILGFMTNYQYFGPHRWKRGNYLRRSPRGYHSWPARYEVACLAFRRPNKSSQSPYSYKNNTKPQCSFGLCLCWIEKFGSGIFSRQQVEFSAGSTSAGVFKAAQAWWCPLSNENEDMGWL